MRKQADLSTPIPGREPPPGLLLKPALRGLTLVETLVVICVLGVLLNVVVPWASTAADSMMLTSQVNTYLSALHLTRSEAIKRNSRMTVCKSADGLSCSEGGGWQQGWIIFHDANHNAEKDEFEVLVHKSPALSSNFQLTGNSNVSNYVSFDATGGTKLASGAFQAGTLTLCRHSPSGGEARKIVINSAGRPRVQKTVVTTCV